MAQHNQSYLQVHIWEGKMDMISGKGKENIRWSQMLKGKY